MNSAAFATVASPALPLSLRVVLDAWRGITARLVGVTLLLGAALALYHAVLYAGSGSFKLEAHPSIWLRLLVLREIVAFALMVCVVVADRVTGRDPSRRAAYAWAIVVGASAGTILAWMQHSLVWNFDWGVAHALYNFLETLMLGGAVVFIYIDRRRAHAALAWMHAAKLGQVRTAKRVLESRLQAMQARVEPRFLFDTLAQIRTLYERDAPLAERVLDELIAYLRAAMPKMRETSSKVGQEIELVRAYLSIVRIRTRDRLAFSIDAPADVVKATLPPMLLLPLVDQLVVQRLSQARPEGFVRIEIWLDRGRLRLSIASDATSPAGPEEAVRGVRERIAALYGDQATLTLRAARESGTEVLLDLPLQPS